MKIDARNPFEVFKGYELELVKESFPKHRRDKLFTIYQYFTGKIQNEQLPEDLRRMNSHQLESYYNHHCTVLFGDLLVQIGTKYQTANPTIQFKFYQESGIQQIDDRTIWYCTECGSQNVELKQWILPNDMDTPAGNESFEHNDRWCKDCEGHTDLKTCKESEYPAILKEIQGNKIQKKDTLKDTQNSLSPKHRIQQMLLNYGVTKLALDEFLKTDEGYIAEVYLEIIEYTTGLTEEYENLFDDVLEDLVIAVEMQIEVNEKAFKRCQD